MSELADQLANNPEYIKRVNDSVETLRSDFIKLKTHLNKPLSDDNFNSAFKLFLNAFDIVPLLTVQPNLRQIVRGRPYYKDEPLCNERWQVSYNWRYQKKIPLGRFNQKGEPLFYGSVPSESKEMDYVLSCCLECCKELSFEYNAPDIQDITLSGWVIEKPLTLIILCFDDVHLSDNPEMRAGVKRYLTAINKYLSKEAASLIEEFLRYFSELSRKISPDNDSYKLTAPLFVAMRYYAETYNKQTIYGLIYPSAMTMAKGLNVVLTREAVKQYLRLDKIVMYRYFLVKPERVRWVADKCSDIVRVKGHKFKITGYIPSCK